MQYLDDDNITNILIHSPYKDVPVNGTYRLYEGAIHLQGPENEVTGQGALEVALYGHPVIRFALSNTPVVHTGGGEHKLNIPAFSCPLPSPAFTLQETTIFAQDSQKRTGILLREGLVIRQLKEDGAQEPVGRMHFHLINFKHYRGEELAQSHGDRVRSWKGRAVFPFGKYIVTLDTFDEASERLKEAQSINGYAFTHVGSMCRADNKLFDPDKGVDALECLGWFFSFANGSYCPCVLPTGYRYLRQPLWQQWNMPHVSLSNNDDNWFFTIQTQECFQAADCFYKCWQDEAKRQWLKTAIGLYLASNRTTDNIELALANAQIPLEMLTWVALMEENLLMSEGHLKSFLPPTRYEHCPSGLALQPRFRQGCGN